MWVFIDICGKLINKDAILIDKDAVLIDRYAIFINEFGILVNKYGAVCLGNRYTVFQAFIANCGFSL